MKDTLVIDLETKKTFDEVGGEKHIAELGISVAGVYSYAAHQLFALEEHELPQLEEMLKKTEHIIGFNINYFDIPVLKPYTPTIQFEKIAVTDMFVDAVNFLGHRVGLAALGEATLGRGKSGHGLEALEWFRQGRIEEVKNYCLDDVRLTRDLYEYGKKHHHVLFTSKYDGKVHSIPVPWGGAPQKPIAKILEDAFEKRQRLSIEYVSSENNDGLGYRKSRIIDIHHIGREEVAAYCHLRHGLRNFRINRILKAEPLNESYTLPRDVQGALFSA